MSTFTARTLARMNATAAETALLTSVVEAADALKAGGVVLTQPMLGALVTERGGDEHMVRMAECLVPFSMGFVA